MACRFQTRDRDGWHAKVSGFCAFLRTIHQGHVIVVRNLRHPKGTLRVALFCRTSVFSGAKRVGGVLFLPPPARSRAVLTAIVKPGSFHMRIAPVPPPEQQGPTMSQHPSQEYLEAYVIGDLRGFRRWVLDRHLDCCAQCRGEAREWERLFATLAHLKRFSPSSGFADRVLQHVRIPQPLERSSESLSWFGQIRRLNSRFVWGAALALATTWLVWGVAGFLLWSHETFNDFQVGLITSLRMAVSEVIVWVVKQGPVQNVARRLAAFTDISRAWFGLVLVLEGITTHLSVWTLS